MLIGSAQDVKNIILVRLDLRLRLSTVVPVVDLKSGLYLEKILTEHNQSLKRDRESNAVFEIFRNSGLAKLSRSLS